MRIVSLATGDFIEGTTVVDLFHKVGGQLAVDPQWTNEVHVALWDLFESPLQRETPIGTGHVLIVD